MFISTNLWSRNPASALYVFNVYFNFTDNQAKSTLNDCYKLIYSKFNAEDVANLEFEYLASFITNKFQLPLSASEKLLIDYSTDFFFKLSDHEYEYIMKELCNIDQNIIKKRIEIFKAIDSDKDGYISNKELDKFLEKYKDDNLFGFLSSKYCMVTFDRNKDGHVNFLDFSKYSDIVYLEDFVQLDWVCFI